MSEKRGLSVWLEVTIKQDGFDEWVAAFDRCCSFLAQAGPTYGLPTVAGDLSAAEKESVGDNLGLVDGTREGWWG